MKGRKEVGAQRLNHACQITGYLGGLRMAAEIVENPVGRLDAVLLDLLAEVLAQHPSASQETEHASRDLGIAVLLLPLQAPRGKTR